MKGVNSEACGDELENSAGGSGSTTKKSKPSEPEITVSEWEEDLDTKIIHKNQPVFMTVYKDPDSLEEKLCVIASLPGGVFDVEFSLIGVHPAVTIQNYVFLAWLVYDIPRIFKKAIDEKQITSCHPLIVSLKNEFKNHRDSIDSTPQGEIEFILPISVQTAPTAISRAGGKTNDGTMIVIVELMAFHNSYTVKQASNKIEFHNL